jgi:hypothetical protein
MTRPLLSAAIGRRLAIKYSGLPPSIQIIPNISAGLPKNALSDAVFRAIVAKTCCTRPCDGCPLP